MFPEKTKWRKKPIGWHDEGESRLWIHHEGKAGVFSEIHRNYGKDPRSVGCGGAKYLLILAIALMGVGCRPVKMQADLANPEDNIEIRWE